jgi:AraC-like DNA-binding protein
MISDKKAKGFSGQKMIVIPKKIIKSLRKNNLTKSLYLTDIGYFPNAKYHFRERPNGAKENIFIYAINGKGTVEIEDKKHKIIPDHFIIIPSSTRHKYYANNSDPWSIYWIHFTGSISNELIKQIYKNGVVNARDASKFDERIKMFEEIYKTIELGYSEENINHSMFTLSHFLSSFIYSRNYTQIKNAKRRDQIEILINFMKANIHNTYSNNSFADLVNLSVSHLSKLFKERTGFSPMEFFIQLKIQKACMYLISTDYKIKEISNLLNYDDPYYFSRVFTKMMGISPKLYRQSHLYKS